MKKILVTGVAGFIGSNLAGALLKKKCRVIGVDNLSYGIKEQVPKGVEFHKADIRSRRIYSLFKRVDTVFHLAAKNCLSDCQQDPLETADVNVSGTVNVFSAARQAKVRKVIYAESSALYEGSSVFPTPETEEKPVSIYACSKLSASYFARSYAAFYGMHITGLRYFNVYGPRQDYRRSIPPVMPAFIIALLKNKHPIIYGTGEKRRDFIYIDDVNNFHLLAMDDDRTSGNIYNLGSGKNYSVKEIYCAIKNLLKKDIAPVYRADFPFEADITLADIHKARAVGWKPAVRLEDGLKILIEYIKEHVINKRR
jgi:UDP-glucose 4-epimerase